MDDDLIASGRYLRIRARGSRTGAARTVTVGYVDDEAEPGALLVASRLGSAWARNLLDDPDCTVETAERTFAAVAVPLVGPDHARAVRELILRYGTPAEGLGHGPSFRLRPRVATDGPPA
jgi:deazaflavin-dependent oxidoreductase (nitroreductase family)